ncbi:MAG: hypothetical protein WBI40_09090 [Methylococcaceae bacterium]
MTVSVQLRALTFKTTLTHHNTPARMNAPHNEVGICNPRNNGDNKPIIKSVFFCLPFLGQLNFEPFKSIMTALFWRPLRSVVPLCDIANQLNAVTRLFAKSSDGFTLQNNGITA